VLSQFGVGHHQPRDGRESKAVAIVRPYPLLPGRSIPLTTRLGGLLLYVAKIASILGGVFRSRILVVCLDGDINWGTGL
jgi:hypothetical protein